jgi:AAA15 family ATPase/GTPase
MLIAFKVNNFMSFADEQKLSMIPSLEGEGYIRLNKIRLLRSAVIFGANSSGKSNFIKAIAFGKDLILNEPALRFRNKYSRVTPENRNKESTFEYTIYSNGHYYTYGFSIILYQGLFTGEYLYEITEDDREKLLYERRGEAITCTLSSEKVAHLQDKIQTSGLILHLSEELTDPIFTPIRYVASWFRNKLKIYFQNQEYLLLESDPLHHRERYLRYLKMFDTGITGFEERKPEGILETLPLRAQKQISSRLEGRGNLSFALRLEDALYSINRSDGKVEVLEICFRHQHTDSVYDFEEESDGTKRLFDLLDIIISPVSNSVYLIDEINRSIHPLVTAEFLRLFKGSLRENNVQILFTTHEASLLSEDLLRRDEIWFMEKEADASKLFSLDIFKKENQVNLASSYLAGKYGGIPLFTGDEEQ